MKCFNLFRAIILSGVLVLLVIFWGNTAHAGWSQPVRISEPGHYEYPQILARGDTLHVVYQDMNVHYRIGYQRSTDGGLTWSPKIVLSHDSLETTFPRIIASGNRLMAIWKNALSGPYNYNIAYSTSTNSGQSWSAQQQILNPPTYEDLYFTASGGNGLNICVVYLTYVADSISFYSIRSTNFGQSWSSPQEIFRTLQAGVPDQAGWGSLVHLAWDGCYHTADPWETYYIRSNDGGTSWSQSIMLSTQDDYGSEIPALGADNNGELSLCWTDGKYSPYMATGDILGRTSIDSGLTWGPEWQASFDHFAWGSDIAVNADTIHSVWTDEGIGIGHRSIYYVESIDYGATWSEPYWIDGTLDDSWEPVLAISNNHVYIMWGDRRPNPDSSLNGGLYISRFDSENDAVNENDSNNIIPNKISLSAYPNPFNSLVTITYSNLKGSEINIYDIQGKLIRTLKIDGGANGKIIWDACDAMGNKVSSGEYFLKAGASQNSSVLKLLYLK